MIYVDYFRALFDEGVAQCKFKFCEGCVLYGECELVEEYAQFRRNHGLPLKAQIPKSKAITILSTGYASASQVSTNVSITLTPVSVSNGESVRKVSPAVDSPWIDKLSYDQEELNCGCPVKACHVYSIACGKQKVTEGIGDHFKIETEYNGKIRAGVPNRWEPLQPIFISAQTGQGKNYFIENELIPYVEKLNYMNNTKHRILILSNRLALRQQIKNRLNGWYDESDDGEDRIYRYKDCADVMTYQSLLKQEQYLKNKQSKAHDRYIYLICDEAHFFTSDAMFNPHTSEILQTIVKRFQDAVRVYMSATPYECLKYITEYEEEYQYLHNSHIPQGERGNGPMVFYHFQRDYSYLDVKSYSSVDELYEKIVESVNNRREKWLIFIDDKERGATTKEKLLTYEKKYAGEHGGSQLLNGGEDGKENEKRQDSKTGEPILVVNAGSKTDENYMSIVKNETLGKNTYVLISTSVLDNGINLMGIKNIVVSDMAKVKCLQMVGRARVSNSNERKTLYIKRFGGSEIDERIRNLKRQEHAYHSYNLAYGKTRDLFQSRGDSEYRFLEKYYNGDERDWEDAKHWFRRTMDKGCKLYPNEIAKSLLDRWIPQYQAIYDEMVEEAQSLNEIQRKDRVNRTGQKYLEYQISWFGGVYCEDDDITFADMERAKKELIAFLEEYAERGSGIETQEEMELFQKQFTSLYDMAFPRADKNKGRSYGYKKMNDLLKEYKLGYKLTGNPQKGPWTVIGFDWEDESSVSQ